MLRLYDAAQTDWDRVAAFQVMRNVKEGADLDDCYRTMMRVDGPQDWYPAWNETGQRWGGDGPKKRWLRVSTRPLATTCWKTSMISSRESG